MREFLDIISESLLNEGGIKTAEIDKRARAALAKALPEEIKKIVAEIEPKLPPKRKGSWGDIDWSEFYDNLSNYLWDEKALLTEPLCAAFSRVLTDVTHEYLDEVIDTIPQMAWVKTEYGSNREFSRYYKVKVEDRETSDDQHKHYGGYHAQHENLIKVFVNQDNLYHAGMGLIQDDLLGEQFEEGLSEMLKVIVPTFVHEYAHAEQALRRKYGTGQHDFGYITTGTKGRAGKGKRGGYHRDPNGGLASYLRYKGNLKEIDSFASDAAAELVHDLMLRAQGWQTVDINAGIQDIRQDLAWGYADGSRTYSHYQDLLRNAFDGAYEEVGMNPKQMEKVFRRFVKRVYEKLGDYKARYPGRAGHSKLNPEYVKIAKGKPFAATVKEIAQWVATRIMRDDENYWSDERRIEAARVGHATGMHEAVDFITEYYFGSDGWFDPRADQTRAIFTRLVTRYLERYLEINGDNRRAA